MAMEIVWQTPANPPEPQDYIFRNGRRLVRPYYFEFISHVKNRWAGKTVVDFFAHEFKGRPYDYYVSAVNCGRIRVDGEMVPVSYILKPSQKISHFLHSYSPRTRCRDRMQAANCSSVHRLDRLVSGLLILARTSSKAEIFRQQIEGGMVKKQYIAKVIGIFPENEVVINVNIDYNAREGRSTAEEGNPCSDSPSKGKPASTKFTRIGTNGRHSLVLCEPITGRTHQIRVHLQYVGHPIANDSLYLSEQGVNRSSGGTTADRAAANSCLNSEADLVCPREYEEECREDFSIDPMCTHCPGLAPKGYGGDEEGLWLHCVRYSGPGWVYECPYPHWAILL
ncbi:RNA pseudouridine synthase 7-like isoform X2 [Punica granatum]|uniref:RNA pseudouridine synthase 7-like isoform X2 n=1 Tax=Punica granatum TaxID=22663 RepID=A0A6P8E987_PUNGR|nr:RNA pseudouridine synthase 7-like isoform X2 [Punica granatum]